jgi:hypothetical protein
MRPRTIWIAAIAASSLLLVTLRGMAHQIDDPPAKQAASATPSSAAARAITIHDGTDEQVRVELAELRADVSKLGGATQPELTYEEQRARDEHDAAEVQAQLAKKFAADDRDPSWSAQAERSLRDAFAAAHVAGGRLEELGCGATLCRYSVAFDSVTQREDGVDAITTLAHWDSRLFGGPVADDPRRFVVYVSRDPDSFPPLQD